MHHGIALEGRFSLRPLVHLPDFLPLKVSVQTQQVEHLRRDATDGGQGDQRIINEIGRILPIRQGQFGQSRFAQSPRPDNGPIGGHSGGLKPRPCTRCLLELQQPGRRFGDREHSGAKILGPRRIGRTHGEEPALLGADPGPGRLGAEGFHQGRIAVVPNGGALGGDPDSNEDFLGSIPPTPYLAG